MTRRAFTLREFVAVLAVLSGAIWLLFPWGHGGRHGSNRRSCLSNQKQIGLAIKQYIFDNDERFPSLSTVAGWRDAIAPFVRDAAIFQCPSEGETQGASADYWFNARLSGVFEARMEAQALTMLLGDGYSTTDPRVALSQLPKSWLLDPKSPAHRHLDGCNFAFADGHVKWLRPEKVTTLKTAKNASTFAFD